MRVAVSSSKSWHDEQAVIDAVSALPASTTFLLPSRQGACAIVLDHANSLKIEIEDWSSEPDDYDARGSSLNSEMLKADVDTVLVFLTPDAHAARDCMRQARLMDLDLQIFGK